MGDSRMGKDMHSLIIEGNREGKKTTHTHSNKQINKQKTPKKYKTTTYHKNKKNISDSMAISYHFHQDERWPASEKQLTGLNGRAQD